ncbi:MAG: hydrolase, partial [Gemmatimonadetes bacterium]|nr:hydrolase [Gemmatimonadota bacterium]
QAPVSSFAIDALATAVTIPVLIVHDTDDDEVPYANGIRFAELLPSARLVTTSGLGHRRVLFAPDVVSAVVDFIEEGNVMRMSLRSVREDA